MITVYSKDHELHSGTVEFHRGELVPCFESPRRIDLILKAIENAHLGKVVPPTEHGLELIQQVHDSRYLQFLESIYDEWRLVQKEGDALPHAWCVRRMQTRIPTNIYGRLGFYSSDAGTPITSGTWQAARSSVNVALTACQLIQGGESSAFALTRPPGHHAAKDFFGGYCFLNNAAIAAQAAIAGGATRVAVLDVDYHHGNGTQDIFWERNDVLFVSIHGDPRSAYPYFLGYPDEIGVGVGEGYTRNYPLPEGTSWDEYMPVLADALALINATKVDVLIVSLGVDTFERDPISAFRLTSQSFLEMGAMIARLRLPTLFVMEGGYAIAEVGENVVNILRGFADV